MPGHCIMASLTCRAFNWTFKFSNRSYFDFIVPCAIYNPFNFIIFIENISFYLNENIVKTPLIVLITMCIICNIFYTYLSLLISREITVGYITQTAFRTIFMIRYCHITCLINPQFSNYYIMDSCRYFGPSIMIPYK